MVRLLRFLSQLEQVQGVCAWSPFSNEVERIPFAVGAEMVYFILQAHKAYANDLGKCLAKECY